MREKSRIFEDRWYKVKVKVKKLGSHHEMLSI